MGESGLAMSQTQVVIGWTISVDTYKYHFLLFPNSPFLLHISGLYIQSQAVLTVCDLIQLAVDLQIPTSIHLFVLR
ncbi:hypothetical protein QVD17_11679 [Tagetes erecta]|uniref:Uncharacterized protein n=1 Tax=Tagetes erecta TaxID=13708 RepID=A0AAD8KTX3_TARER|nr:hypothetical protein QVD17_11679 [Tagetes erecta]